MTNPTRNNYYITTSIPYANARPHLGHAMEFIQADTLARWHRQKGLHVYLQVGTDEHGQKLYEAAHEAGVEPLNFVNEMSESFVQLARDLHIDYDAFVRTTDTHHKQGAQALWRACQKDIYKGTYTGLYCVACELFYTAKDAVEDKCPLHPNRELEELAIESYFLRLAPYQERLIALLESDEYRIFPTLRKNEILSFLKNNKLADLSISRPKSQLEWGVEVPDDSTHVMYVWFDALANYITGVGYPNDKDFAKWWPANLHIVGKDINRFHSVYWPIMLMSAGLTTPKALYVHGFINAPGGVKMSKSLGNSVEPGEIIDQYGAEALRYYLLRYIPHDADGEFSMDRFYAVYTADLVNNLGNLVQRVASMSTKYCDGHFTHLSELRTPQLERLEDARFDDILQDIWSQLDALNESIDKNEPWQLAKTNLDAVQNLLDDWIHNILQIAVSLKPFLPATSEKMHKIFADGQVDMRVGVLFPRLEKESGHDA
ncbi:methionine--tRNA ligase [bacterium]|nr:MAG: methionine--tRNA ligase [bacterium]